MEPGIFKNGNMDAGILETLSNTLKNLELKRNLLKPANIKCL